MIPFNREVYYFLNKKNSINEIIETIRKSNEVWHSLFILTQIKEPFPAILTDETLNQICENAKFVIVGAYDGEGYIFWEKE